jgi:hypothetical protein
MFIKIRLYIDMRAKIPTSAELVVWMVIRAKMLLELKAKEYR